MNLKKTFFFSILVLVVVGYTFMMCKSKDIPDNNLQIDASFKKIVLDDEDISKNVIKNNGSEVDFTTNKLNKIGDESVLEYTISNNSKEYNVDVEVNCELPSSDLYSITNENDNEMISSNSSIKGKIYVKLKEEVEKSTQVSCNLKLIIKEKKD